jgi:hypothetical protein
MYRSAFLQTAAGDQRQPAPGVLPLSHLPGFVDAAAAQVGNALRSVTPANASPGAERLARQVPGWCISAEPGDLVARALAILAEDAETRQARGCANVSLRSIR